MLKLRKYSITLLFLISILMMILANLNYKDYIFAVGIFSIIHFFISFSYCTKRFGLISVITFFIILIYLFNFGNFIINLFDTNYIYSSYNFLYNFEYNINIYASLYVFLFLSFLLLGIEIFYEKLKNKLCTIKTKSKITESSNNTLLLIFSILIIITTFPIELYLTINRINIMFSEGYLATYNVSINGYLYVISQLYIVGFMMLILTFKNDKKKCYPIIFFIILYLIISMFSGHRGKAVINICVLLLICFKSVIKLTPKTIIFFIIVGFISLFFISGLSSIRATSTQSFTNAIISIFSVRNNPLIKILDEFGFTFFTLDLTIQNNLNHSEYTFGLTYIASLASIFPNVGRIIPSLIDFATIFSKYNWPALGGSMIAETFKNFSFFGVFTGLGFGFLTSLINLLLEKILINKQYYLVGLIFIFISTFFWWIRDTFLDIPRIIIISFLFLLFIFKVANIIHKKLMSYKDDES